MISKITESRNFGLVLGLIVLLIIAAIITPSMYSVNSIVNMLQNNAVYGLLAIGEMMVILTGGIDISIGAILSLSGVVCCRLMAEKSGCTFDCMDSAGAGDRYHLRCVQWSDRRIFQDGSDDRHAWYDVRVPRNSPSCSAAENGGSRTSLQKDIRHLQLRRSSGFRPSYGF